MSSRCAFCDKGVAVVCKCSHISGVLSARLEGLRGVSWVVSYVACEVATDVFAFAVFMALEDAFRRI